MDEEDDGLMTFSEAYRRFESTHGDALRACGWTHDEIDKGEQKLPRPGRGARPAALPEHLRASGPYALGRSRCKYRRPVHPGSDKAGVRRSEEEWFSSGF